MIDEIVREGARPMLAEALQAEVGLSGREEVRPTLALA